METGEGEKMKKLIVFVLAMVMIVCGTITAFAATSDSTTTTTTKATTDTHTCHISRANENYHHFDCDECENYARVNHDKTTLVHSVKNEFFHTWYCSDCGFEYAEKHDFETESDGASHWEVCVICGYTSPKEAHTMVNAFYGNNHDVECEYCGHVAEHHVRAKYTTIDSTSCTATCGCGVVEVVEHDFDGFVCDNCNYAVTGTTCGMVERITEYDDYYRIRLNVEDVTFRVKVTDLTVAEGDSVVIEHDGNEIYSIRVVAD